MYFSFSCTKETDEKHSTTGNVEKNVTYNITADNSNQDLNAIVRLKIIRNVNSVGTGDAEVWDTLIAQQKLSEFKPLVIKHTIFTDNNSIFRAIYSIEYYNKSNEFFWLTNETITIFQNIKEADVNVKVGSF